MYPVSTDVVALAGIAIAVCAAVARLALLFRLGKTWFRVLLALTFALLWVRVGAADIPVVAYVRGVSSDLSITLVALCSLYLYGCLRGVDTHGERETRVMNMAIAAAALTLYPLALGWSDWDAYRLGWTPRLLWVVLLAVSLVSMLGGLRRLPLVIGLAVLGWAAGLMESTNLWDYLIDPWLAIGALYSCAAALKRVIHRRVSRPTQVNSAPVQVGVQSFKRSR